MPVWGLIRNIKTLLGFLSWRSPLLWSWKDKPTFVNMWLNAYLWVPLSCLRKGEWHHVLSICHLWCKELRKCGTSFKIENNEENGSIDIQGQQSIRLNLGVGGSVVCAQQWFSTGEVLEYVLVNFGAFLFPFISFFSLKTVQQILLLTIKNLNSSCPPNLILFSAPRLREWHHCLFGYMSKKYSCTFWAPVFSLL